MLFQWNTASVTCSSRSGEYIALWIHCMLANSMKPLLSAVIFLVVLLNRDKYEKSCSISSPGPYAAFSCHLPPQITWWVGHQDKFRQNAGQFVVTVGNAHLTLPWMCISMHDRKAWSAWHSFCKLLLQFFLCLCPLPILAHYISPNIRNWFELKM